MHFHSPQSALPLLPPEEDTLEGNEDNKCFLSYHFPLKPLRRMSFPLLKYSFVQPTGNHLSRSHKGEFLFVVYRLITAKDKPAFMFEKPTHTTEHFQSIFFHLLK
jgi:hypothetical protein